MKCATAGAEEKESFRANGFYPGKKGGHFKDLEREKEEPMAGGW